MGIILVVCAVFIGLLMVIIDQFLEKRTLEIAIRTHIVDLEHVISHVSEPQRVDLRAAIYALKRALE